VGIGVVNPGEKLELDGNFLFSNASTISTGTGDLTINPNPSNNLLLTTASGAVGIGLTNPSEKLEINGNLRFRNASTISSAAGDLTLNPASNLLLASTTTGNVRIGNVGSTTAPLNEKFEIAGNIVLHDNPANPGDHRIYGADGDATTNGTKLFMIGGWGQNGGGVDLIAGNTIGSGGNAGSIRIIGGASTTGGNAGNVTIQGGTSTSSGIGNVLIQTGSASSGTVGIGTSTPSSSFRVDIAGAGRITSGVWASSDRRYKKEISPLEGSMDRLMALEGVNYFFRTEEFEKMNFGEEMQYGFIAQEMEEIYPDLVKTDEEGFKAVNYTALIPELVEALKGQQAEINALKSELARLNGNSPTNGFMDNLEGAKLYQNVPNPWNTATQIRYDLPAGIDRAQIMIFDVQGTLKSTYDVSGEPLELKAGSLPAGMYLYSLVIEGQEVETKKMILSGI
jgi:hypothetical protein